MTSLSIHEDFDSWVARSPGRNVQVAQTSATVETYTYRQSTETLFVIVVTYTAADRLLVASVERTV